MKGIMKVSLHAFATLGLIISITSIHAATVDEILHSYEAEAKKENKAFKAFSSDDGKKFFLAEHTNKKGESMSCTTCHTKDPTKSGKTKAGKVIEPMAVVANKERFTDRAKVEKWFKRNCGDVYDRACTAIEKGNFISFMKSAK